MAPLYIGLMSGTSMDGIDAALVRFGDHDIDLVATVTHPYPDSLRDRLAAAIRAPDACDVDTIGSLDRAVGCTFRDAAIELLAAAGRGAASVRAIGSHGQTIRHQPRAREPFTLQIGDPAIIASGTAITTVADFRRADLAVGGEGAPLAPAFHEWLFRERGRARAVLNIGGIANLTLLPGDDAPVTGFDTGPGNTLLDAWIRQHHGRAYDRDGAWADAGSVDPDLLARLLADPYFAAPPPKSTGLEHFNLEWLAAHGVDGIDPADTQATLAALTIRSIADAVPAATVTELLVCGGGAHNAVLMAGLAAALPGVEVASTAAHGLDPDWVEAVAFAWLAMRRIEGLPGNLPSVTGASRAVALGAVHAPD